MTTKDDHTPGTGAATAGGAATSGDEAPHEGEASQPEPQPKSGNRMTRLAGESRALFDDLREWVDLRVQLVQVEIEERIEKMANELIAIIIVVVLGLFAVAFLLHGVAIWIGEALGGTQWGYLIVAGVLGLITLIVKATKPDFVGHQKKSEPAQIPAPPTTRKLEQTSSSPMSTESADKEQLGEGDNG